MTVRLILWLFLCAAIPVSSAEPMYYCSRRLSRTPSTTRPSITRYIIARPVSSYRQRRPISNTNPYATRQQQQQPRDYSTIFLDVDEFQRDKKARIWQVNFKTRQPGKYSWATRLVIANVLCYLAQSWNPRITQMFVKDSAKILRGQELYRLLTPVFLHGGVAHLAMNMYSLRNIGPDVEKLFGPGRFGHLSGSRNLWQPPFRHQFPQSGARGQWCRLWYYWGSTRVLVPQRLVARAARGTNAIRHSTDSGLEFGHGLDESYD